jgi:hypothetical protein
MNPHHGAGLPHPTHVGHPVDITLMYALTRGNTQYNLRLSHRLTMIK